MTSARKTQDSEYVTKDMRLAITLQARGARVLENGIYEVDGIYYFTFNNNEVKDDVRAYQTGQDLEVDIQEMWRAYSLFRSLMHDSSKDMRVVVSMLAQGCKPAENGGVSAQGRLLRFKFDGDEAEEAKRNYLENRSIPVSHRDFWKAYSFFKQLLCRV